MKIARTYTGRSGIVVLDHAFHGRTHLASTMTAKNKPYRDLGGPLSPEVHRVPVPYPFRWPGGPQHAAEQAIARLVEIVETQLSAHNVAAIVVERRCRARADSSSRLPATLPQSVISPHATA